MFGYLWIIIPYLILLLITPIFSINLLIVIICAYFLIKNKKNEINNYNNDVYSIRFLSNNAPIAYVTDTKYNSIIDYIDDKFDNSPDFAHNIDESFSNDRVKFFVYKDENSNSEFDHVVMFYRIPDNPFKEKVTEVFTGRAQFYIDGTAKFSNIVKVEVGVDGRVAVNPRAKVDNFPEALATCNKYRDRIKANITEEYNKKRYSVYSQNNFKVINKRKYDDIYNETKNSNCTFGKNKVKYIPDPFSAFSCENSDDMGLHECYLIKEDNGELFHGYIETFPYYSGKKKRFVGNIIYD